MADTQQAEVIKDLPGKVVLSFSKPTPLAAIWVFRIFFGITKVAAVWLAATTLLSKDAKFEILLAFTALDGLVWIIARGLGVDRKQFEEGS